MLFQYAVSKITLPQRKNSMKFVNMKGYLSLIALLALLFSACGDSSTSTDSSGETSEVAAEKENATEKDLVCDSSVVGIVEFFADSNASYFCDGSKWRLLKGSTGNKGPDGENGANGATAEPGVQGAIGKIGDAGGDSDVDCEIASDSAGIVIIKCSDGTENKLNKATCGSQVYEPMEYFCSGGKLYDNKLYMKDYRDNQLYRIVTIGSGDSAVIWMAENLNYDFNDGVQSWCYDCEKYGRLYTWAGALGKSEEACGFGRKCQIGYHEQGACPSGWHVPDRETWMALFDYEKEEFTAAVMLRSVDGWPSGSLKATDDLGFAALPGGFYRDGQFYETGSTALFWTASSIDLYSSQTYGMKHNEVDVTYDGLERTYGLSLRCVKD